MVGSRSIIDTKLALSPSCFFSARRHGVVEKGLRAAAEGRAVARADFAQHWRGIDCMLRARRLRSNGVVAFIWLWCLPFVRMLEEDVERVRDENVAW